MKKLKFFDYGAGDCLICPSCNNDYSYLHITSVEHKNDDISIVYSCETCGNENVLDIFNEKGHKRIGWYDGKSL